MGALTAPARRGLAPLSAALLVWGLAPLGALLLVRGLAPLGALLLVIAGELALSPKAVRAFFGRAMSLPNEPPKP